MSSLPSIIVTGVPRSGTSLMMSCLEAAGVPVFYNAEHDKTLMQRFPDANAGGFYESLPRDREGQDLAGKAVKCFLPGVADISATNPVYVIFMRRDFKESVESFKKYILKGREGNAERFAAREKRMQKVLAELQAKENVTLLEVWLRDLVDKPKETLGTVKDFLDTPFDTAAAQTIIKPELYRTRL